MSRTISLTKGYVTVVDDCDFDELSLYSWFAQEHPSGKVYARRTSYEGGRKTLVQMHQQIMGALGRLVDHRDGDGLNNQRINLREATKSQNAANSKKRSDNVSGFIGVYRGPGISNPWRSYVQKDGKKFHAGCFVTKEDAARSRDLLAISLHGDFAVLNFEGV